VSGSDPFPVPAYRGNGNGTERIDPALGADCEQQPPVDEEELEWT
jgi:hypothetical protein